ncbi:unnamed protein product [Allacma fusca]|uniref:Chitin-binding type-2 domain-containing protein n=1 Tax=Allacma fusca TaxID=39272 RepID=A0A8J2KXS9_9HEXA|nr:unnamed protein product [Allacma fusca]
MVGKVQIVFGFAALVIIGVCANPRSKRQSDSTTEVVGLSLDSEATAGDYQTLKSGSRSISRPRERRRRDDSEIFFPEDLRFHPKNFGESFPLPRKFKANIVSNFHHPHDNYSHHQMAEAFHNGTKELAKHMLTAIQTLFQKISFNFNFAKLFQHFVISLKNAVLKRMVILNENGVKCEDVCKPGSQYGTIGICTEKYCTCDFNSKNFTLFCCEKDFVFDHLRHICEDPSKTILCSDDIVQLEDTSTTIYKY